ncbi:MAG: DegT/DnrJ/EryC1/StrS family aminotransferase [Chloroflexi bacterium]|nr:DegT/DnrJ/EryC1/StrS family aminotransferase [Chloroflexota bacterium]
MIRMASPAIGKNEIECVIEVLESGMLAQGAKVHQFEEAFASYIGTKYAVATSNGTTALHTALLAAGIKDGDEVITTPFSFIATGNAILFCGAKPVFVDIEEKTFNLDPNLIEPAITPKTKAVMVVHLYGQPCDMDKIGAICRKHDLILIEDACQAHGSEYNGNKVGSFGTGCFSFYPTKNMTTGEGGMITTNDSKIAKSLGMIRNHGQNGRYHHEILGYNFRMTDISAALGLCQLEQLDEFNRKRIENATFLTEAIRDIDGLIPPHVTQNAKHVFHQFTIRVTDEFGISREEFQQRLNEKGIDSAIHYRTPIHQQPAYQNLGYRDQLPVAEKAAQEVLSLPIHPNLSKDDLNSIVQGLKDAR